MWSSVFWVPGVDWKSEQASRIGAHFHQAATLGKIPRSEAVNGRRQHSSVLLYLTTTFNTRFLAENRFDK